MNQFPPQPQSIPFRPFTIFSEIFASQSAPPLSTTLVANLPPASTTRRQISPLFFASVATSVNDSGGKFATGVNYAGGKLPPISTTPEANLLPCRLCRWKIRHECVWYRWCTRQARDNAISTNSLVTLLFYKGQVCRLRATSSKNYPIWYRVGDCTLPACVPDGQFCTG